MIAIKTWPFALAVAAIPAAQTGVADPVLGYSLCHATDFAGRATPGPAPRVRLYETLSELLFDFHDLAFGTGQSTTYNGANLVASDDSRLVFANLNFVAFVGKDRSSAGDYPLTVEWDDTGNMPGEWQNNRKTAVVAFTCRTEAGDEL